MNSERKAFEEWFESEYLNCKISELNDTEYWRELIQYSWEAWQASAQRQGYKLVPVEPTYRQLDALKNSCALFQNIGVSDIEANGAYKAMIGAVDEN